MNFFKVLLIGYTWIRSLRTVISRKSRGNTVADNEPLVTIGDSMQSFLNKNDVYTRGRCLASHTDFEPRRWKRNQKPESRRWEGKVVRKFRMASKRDWIATISACTAMIIIVLALLISTISQQKGEGSGTSYKALWEEGIGRAHPMEIVQIFTNRGFSQSWGTVFFANSWQLEISILYFLYNTLLTRVCVAVEWSHFGTKKGASDKDSHKFLRISTPSGMQRSTYVLSLPFRYSIPLAAALLLLHWLVSQSIFIARASAFLPNLEPDDTFSSSRVGYSSTGIIFCLIVGSILILTLIAIGFQKTEYRLPFVSTCSAATSAACHQPEDDQNAALLPIEWGDVNNPRENAAQPGHCSLTTLWDVKEPVRGRFYQ